MKRLLVLLSTVVAALAIASANAHAASGTAATAAPAGAGASTGASSMPLASDLDAYLAAKGSPMAGQGSSFVASGGRWQIDPRLLIAIAGAESSFGAITCAPFNAWGWGCPNRAFTFDSWADGIDTVAEGLRTNYLSEGRTTVAAIHQKYAPIGAGNDPTGLNNHWTINVSRFLVEMGGNPSDVDMDGVAGTMPIGPHTVPGVPGETFAFGEEGGDETDAPADGAAAGDAAEDDPDGEAGGEDGPDLVVAAGDPRPLVVRVRNTGTVAWRARDVRLLRVDDESRIGGAPVGALDGSDAVPPGEVAEFHVDLAALGSHTGEAVTRWRLEGPTGPFGDELERRVRFAVPAFVAGESRVEVRRGSDGIGTVVVHVRNAGSADWERDGEAGVLLGLRRVSGGTVTPIGWPSTDVAARMLERRAGPGEEASFAFRVGAGGGTLELQLRRGGTWAAGSTILVAPAR